MQRNVLSAVVAGGAGLLILVSMLSPWWTADFEFSGSGSMFGGQEISNAGDASARPFDDGGLIDGGEAALSGTLVLLAFLGAVGVAVVGFVRPQLNMLRIGLASGSAFLLALAALLAPLTWPGDGVGFWDSGSGSLGGFSTSMSTYAAFGWYVAIVAVVAMAAAAFLTLPQDSGAPAHKAAPTATPTASAPAEAATGPVQCQGTTKAGSQCSRRATNGTFCATHG